MTLAPRRASGRDMNRSFPLPGPMRRALDLAASAAAAGEVPVGAVVTRQGEILAEAGNAMRGQIDPTAHAEIRAIRAAAERLGSPRLDDCELWVTLEPCAMCAAAISLARIARLTFAAEDAKAGGVLHGARIFSQSPATIGRKCFPGSARKRPPPLRTFFAARPPTTDTLPASPRTDDPDLDPAICRLLRVGFTGIDRRGFAVASRRHPLPGNAACVR